MNKFSKFKSLIVAPLLLGGGLMLGTPAHAYTINVGNTAFYTGNNYTSYPGAYPASASFSSVLYETRSIAAASDPTLNFGYTGAGFGYVNGYQPDGNAAANTFNSSSNPWCLSSNCILTLSYNFTSSSQGTLQVYANNTNNFDPYTNPTTPNPLLQNAAEQGTLLLSLVADNFTTTIHPNSAGNDAQITFSGNFVAPTNDSSGALLNYLFEGPNNQVFFAVGGNTNTGQTSTGPTGYFYQQGNGTGAYYAVPEPSDLGMMGLGLLMVGLMGLRFRQSRFRRS